MRRRLKSILPLLALILTLGVTAGCVRRTIVQVQPSAPAYTYHVAPSPDGVLVDGHWAWGPDGRYWVDGHWIGR